MASNGGAAFAPVVTALGTMQSNVERSQKSQAHEFLEKFQKSPEAWASTHAILESSETPVEVKLFAATTLKGKITYDLDQLPNQAWLPLRDSVLRLLTTFREGPRPIRTQLCVCLANLAIQMLDWQDPISFVGNALGSSGSDCVLEFMRILPEEVTEGRKINLSEDDLATRTKELLEDNSRDVLNILKRYAQSSPNAASNPRLLECIASWLREIPVAEVVNSPLFDAIIKALEVPDSFDAAVECLCTILRDTQEVDESIEVIQVIFPRLLTLRPRIAQAAQEEDQETFKGLTRIFAEAGEQWVVMIARLPTDFRGLVEAVLECCARDTDREAISLTFLFWYELKQYITLPSYKEALETYSDVYGKLVDIMVKHLEYPTPEDGNENDLFDGDREQEEKFREFRHQMGDVLKDCCEVISVTDCLGKAFALIKAWMTTYASQATKTAVPHWQKLEAPLFSMRAMGRMVSPDESEVLHQLIPVIVQILQHVDHEKLRFQAIMALGRYTEWTARHPQFLQDQLQFVMDAFKIQTKNKEVVKAAALAFRFFGSDCRDLLADHVERIHQFYESVIDELPPASQEEVTEGVACIISVQPIDKIYPALKLYCDPLIHRLVSKAQSAQSGGGEAAQLSIADYVQLITIFIQTIQPYVPPNVENPAVKYCREVVPVLSALAENFTTSIPILERVCRCWRYMVLSYRTAALPLLESLAPQLAAGFQNTRQGCFLWATDAVLREFASGTDDLDTSTSQNVYKFFEQQALAFLRIMNNLPPGDLPDVIEDFYRLLIDALLYYHTDFIPSNICAPLLQAAISALTLQQEAPLNAVLHFLRDLLSYGTDRPNASTFDNSNNAPPSPPLSTSTSINAAAAKPPTTTKSAPSLTPLKPHIHALLSSQGLPLTQRILTGMMFSLPRDCFPDASGVLLSLFEIQPEQTVFWVRETLGLLPAGSIKQGEADRLLNNIATRLQAGELGKVRTVLQDFTNGYRRRNVAPREGLGKLEARRFRFNG